MSASHREINIRPDNCSDQSAGQSHAPSLALITRTRALVRANLKQIGKNTKRLVQGCLEPLGCSVYICRGRRPLTVGYAEYRNRYVRRVIRNDELMNVFYKGGDLPPYFGARLDERVVEYPWVLSRLGRNRNKLRVLDAGSTLNYEAILRHPTVKDHKWSIVTLAPETECFWDMGISYLYEDLRSLPCQEEWFDAVTCISTIEHVGMDNVLVTKDDSHRENRPQDFLRAAREMSRVLKPGGTLFLTVPFGRYEHLGWLQQFDSSMVSTLISEFRPRKVQKTFFRYTSEGWKLAGEDECSGLHFSDAIRNKHAGLRRDSVRGFAADYAVAARSVACLELQK